MKECISIHVGGTGTILSRDIWKTYSLEHKIQDTILKDPKGNYKKFFHEDNNGILKSRAILIDSDPFTFTKSKSTDIDFSFVSDKYDASSNYAKGYLGCTSSFIESIDDKIRLQAEKCDSLDGFIFIGSIGGGTGSGLTTKILENLSSDYAKAVKINFPLYSDKKYEYSNVEPYNTVLSTHSTYDYFDCTFMIDNDEISRISNRHFNNLSPSLLDLNEIITHIICASTCSFRFDSSYNENLRELTTNQIWVPRLHFSLISYAPFYTKEKVASNNDIPKFFLRDVISADHQVLKCYPKKGKVMALNFLYRGKYELKDISAEISSARPTIDNFLEDCGLGTERIGLCKEPLISLPNATLGLVENSLISFSNTSAIVDVWSRIMHRYNLMYSKKAFMHFYLKEGVEESLFDEAKENLEQLKKDYYEVEMFYDFSDDNNDEQ